MSCFMELRFRVDLLSSNEVQESRSEISFWTSSKVVRDSIFAATSYIVLLISSTLALY